MDKERAEMTYHGVERFRAGAIVGGMEVTLDGQEQFVEICLNGQDGSVRLATIHGIDDPAGAGDVVAIPTRTRHLDPRVSEGDWQIERGHDPYEHPLQVLAPVDQSLLVKCESSEQRDDVGLPRWVVGKCVPIPG